LLKRRIGGTAAGSLKHQKTEEKRNSKMGKKRVKKKIQKQKTEVP